MNLPRNSNNKKLVLATGLTKLSYTPGVLLGDYPSLTNIILYIGNIPGSALFVKAIFRPQPFSIHIYQIYNGNEEIFLGAANIS